MPMVILNGTGRQIADIISFIVTVREAVNTGLILKSSISEQRRSLSSSTSNRWHIWSWLSLAGGKLNGDAFRQRKIEIIF